MSLSSTGRAATRPRARPTSSRLPVAAPWRALALALALALLTPGAAAAARIWEGEARRDGLVVRVALELELDAKGPGARAAFFNGDERVRSTSGSLDGERLALDFAHYATTLRGTLAGEELRATYSTRTGPWALELRPRRAAPAWARGAPDIAGLWTLPTGSKKGEQAYRFIVRQRGSKVSAAILRVDGDTGLLTGGWTGERFRLDHFDGARAYVLDVVPRADGRLELALQSPYGPQSFTAIRPRDASASGIEPSDFARHTRWKDPSRPFTFSAPDLAGRQVTERDPRFAGKVLVVNVTGSWCPNCHDEAPFLAELYRRYRGLGLEVVALSFEEAEQLADPRRLQAFVARYGIDYTYLLAGEPSQVGEKIPGAENLNAWPTTFFVGRDGRVRGSHTGFAAPASGEFHRRLRRDFADLVEKLLAEGG
ncbi:MAG: TlpA family protein disulfide reductase [Steroidobacteraceae bacterium]|jgi:thiol-disulfide isomerase/thioredoxin|nr:TlpA family protein disulfide reductase [Steroidobacteraceae bacterium]